ncbi:MAG: hypothetical protein ONB49_12165 [candidate division KSB1 bacterium]|nr:hypothetical protein [candidate division KSB1 bacterium]
MHLLLQHRLIHPCEGPADFRLLKQRYTGYNALVAVTAFLQMFFSSVFKVCRKGGIPDFLLPAFDPGKIFICETAAELQGLVILLIGELLHRQLQALDLVGKDGFHLISRQGFRPDSVGCGQFTVRPVGGAAVPHGKRFPMSIQQAERGFFLILAFSDSLGIFQKAGATISIHHLEVALEKAILILWLSGFGSIAIDQGEGDDSLAIGIGAMNMQAAEQVEFQF